MNITELLNEADRRSHAAVKTIDAKVLAGPSGQRRKGSDRLVTALANVLEKDPSDGVLHHVSEVRRGLKAIEAEAIAAIDSAESIAHDLNRAADYLDDQAPAPAGLPESVVSALMSIKAAESAGQPVAPALRAELRRAAEVSLKRCQHMRTVADLRFATASLGFCRKGSDYLRDRADECADSHRAEVFRRGAHRLAANAPLFQQRHHAAQAQLRKGGY